MRITTCVAGGIMLFCAAFVFAQEPPPEEYVQAMQDIGAAMQTLSGFSESQDYEAASAAAASAVTAFAYVQEFWGARETDARTLAAAAWKAASDVVVVAGLNSAEGVTFAVTQMGDTCTPCHTAHRDRLEDGSFVIIK